MPVKIVMTMQEKGAISMFNLSISRIGNFVTNSSEAYEIDNKAIRVWFRISETHKLSVLLKKMQNNELYEVNIICKTLNLLKEVVNPCCSDWIEIGALTNYCPFDDCYLYHAEVHVIICSNRVNAALVKLFLDLDLTDFKLSTEDGSVVTVHRAHLAAHSEIFKAMLTGKWKETDEGIMEIKGLTLETLQHFKEYLYLGTLPDAAGLRPLLLLASQYCVENLKAECITKLARTVLPENVRSLLDFACDSKLPELFIAVAQK